MQEYLKAYPHLRNPATIDLLRLAIKTWFRIQDLEKDLENAENTEQRLRLNARIDRLQRTWMSMLGNLAVSFTRIQYKGTKKRVQPPIDRLKMLKRKKGKSPHSRQTASKQPNGKEQT